MILQSQFDKYAAILLEWNAIINLTAITDIDDIRLKHFDDSLSISRYIPESAALADVGSGAGFPGLPIAITRPDVSVTLIESLGKRVAFLNAVIEALGLPNAQAVAGRAEELGKLINFREAFDIATARAVAPLNVLAELCLPLVKPGGAFIALKGESAAEEAAQAAPLIEKLGGGQPTITPYAILNHQIVVIPKNAATPPNYPRRASRLGRIT